MSDPHLKTENGEGSVAQVFACPSWYIFVHISSLNLSNFIFHFWMGHLLLLPLEMEISTMKSAAMQTMKRFL